MENGEMSADSFSRLRGHLVAATTDLFAAYGMTVELAPETPIIVPHGVDQEVVFAVIGYAGESMRGAIVLVATCQNVKAWHTGLDEDNASVEAIHDTVGEFANMMLGRLKIAMLKQGVSFLMTTPTTASGTDVRIPLPHAGMSAWLRFVGTSGRFEVRLDATFDVSFRFNTRLSKEPPAAAGDILLF
jgi:CheY-specific phosphatase CheX